jgi:hypothetical protein
VIAETVIAAVTIVTVSSLWFSKKIVELQQPPEKPPPPPLTTFEERRRVLERQRAWWLGACSSECPQKNRENATEYVLELDQQLLALAKEENDRG